MIGIRTAKAEHEQFACCLHDHQPQSQSQYATRSVMVDDSPTHASALMYTVV
ncbi:hypothetical protein RP20_CCG001939 [Aedes albopictus]|nr:hypothetical protein RP20_CCG001939 [Aedes albopictus]